MIILLIHGIGAVCMLLLYLAAAQPISKILRVTCANCHGDAVKTSPSGAVCHRCGPLIETFPLGVFLSSNGEIDSGWWPVKLTTSFVPHVSEPRAEKVRFTGRGGLYREPPEEPPPPQTEDPERRVCAQVVIHVGVPALFVLYFSMLYLNRYEACLRIGAWLLLLLVAYRKYKEDTA